MKRKQNPCSKAVKTVKSLKRKENPESEDKNRSSSDWERKLKSLLVCPLTGATFNSPVIASDGYTYEKAAILRHCQEERSRHSDYILSPITRLILDTDSFLPNRLVEDILSLQTQPPPTQPPQLNILSQQTQPPPTQPPN